MGTNRKTETNRKTDTLRKTLYLVANSSSYGYH